MSEMTLTAARANFAEVVDDVRVKHEPLFLTRHGRRVVALVDAADLERLIEAAEDLADLLATAQARAEREAGAAPIPWEEIKAELGL